MVLNQVKRLTNLQVNIRNVNISGITPTQINLRAYFDLRNPSGVPITIQNITGQVLGPSGNEIAIISAMGINRVVERNALTTLEIPLVVSNLAVGLELLKAFQGNMTGGSVKIIYHVVTNLIGISGTQIVPVNF